VPTLEILKAYGLHSRTSCARVLSFSRFEAEEEPLSSIWVKATPLINRVNDRMTGRGLEGAGARLNVSCRDRGQSQLRLLRYTLE
jgi:hypothetical protein